MEEILEDTIYLDGAAEGGCSSAEDEDFLSDFADKACQHCLFTFSALDRFSLLPYECQIHIFLQLPIKDLGAVASVCKRWWEFSNDQFLWRKLYERHFGGPKPPAKKADVPKLLPAAVRDAERKERGEGGRHTNETYDKLYRTHAERTSSMTAPRTGRRPSRFESQGTLALSTAISHMSGPHIVHKHRLSDPDVSRRPNAAAAAAAQSPSPLAEKELSWKEHCIDTAIKCKQLQSDCRRLLWAAARGHTSLARHLIVDKATDVDCRSARGATPLWFAAQNSHLAVAKLLLDYAADPEARPESGGTPLFIAALKGHTSIVSLLIEKGADVEATHTKTGAGPLYVAAEKGNNDTVRELIRCGAQINKRGNDGASPLYIASQMGNTLTVSLLLDNGGDIEAKFHTNSTPLYIAAQRGHTATVRLLLERGAFIDAPRKGGATPLLIATKEGHASVVKLLLKRGANPHAVTTCSKTVLDYAQQSNLLHLFREYAHSKRTTAPKPTNGDREPSSFGEEEEDL